MIVSIVGLVEQDDEPFYRDCDAERKHEWSNRDARAGMHSYVKQVVSSFAFSVDAYEQLVARALNLGKTRTCGILCAARLQAPKLCTPHARAGWCCSSLAKMIRAGVQVWLKPCVGGRLAGGC